LKAVQQQKGSTVLKEKAAYLYFLGGKQVSKPFLYRLADGGKTYELK